MKALLVLMLLLLLGKGCPAGQFDSNGICYDCDITCKSCTAGSNAACLTCDSTRQLNAIKACQCIDGYVQSSPPVTQCSALTCRYSCLTCNITATTCTSCKTSDQRLLVTSNSTCACQPRYYDDGSNSACQPCHYSCTTCSSDTDITCLTCDQPTTFRTLTSSSCPCDPKYYDNSVYVCLSCNYKCKTCSGSAANCVTCGANRGSAPACACSTGFYDDGVSEGCQTCNYTCLGCTNGTSCTSCDSAKHRQLSSLTPLCACMNRYYDAAVALCSACDPRCFTCSSSSVCLTCNPASYRQYSPTPKFCTCMQGYFQTSATVELCSKCDSRCLTCSSVAASCTSCDQANNRQLTSTTCPCKAYFFENSNTLCQGCQGSCYTCTNATECTGCKPGTGMTVNASKLCSCPAGKYYNDVSGICQGCHYSCSTCGTSATQCLTCPTSTHRTYSSFACPCDVYFYDDGSNPTCAGCHYSCKTCSSNSLSSCLTCTSTAYRYSSSNRCLCQTLYYDDGSSQLCQPCLYSCLTCSNPTSCSSCNTTNYRVIDTTVTPNACRCFDYYFEYNRTCVACTYSCKTCNDHSHCLTCDSSTDHRQYNSSTLLCDCQIGYYDNFVNRGCMPCLPQCLTCTNASACTSCDSTRHRSLTATFFCPCINSYFDVSGTCTGCLYHCASCSSPSTCSTCNSTALRKLSGSSLCICADNYYDDGVHELCLACSYACLTCVSTSTTCTSCDTTLRILQSNWCACAQHYYDNNATVACPKCHYSCSTCLEQSKCNNCNSTNQRSFDVASQYCICAVGYFDDLMNELCLKCHYRCLTCTNSSQCLTCSAASFRALPASMCPCTEGYYDDGSSNVCLPCHYSCKGCTNGSQCLSCDLNTNHRKLVNTNYLCGCVDRYFDDLLSHQTCLPCLYSCLTCVSTSTTCTSCNSTAFRVISSTSCPCQQRYYDNNQELCLPCSYSCSKCVNPNQCTECNATRHRIADSSNDKCKCDVLFWDDSVKEECQACHPTCYTCIDLTNCLSCNSTRNRLLNSTTDIFGVSSPYCVCNYRYYSPALTQDCQPCHYSCQVCTGGNRGNCVLCTPQAKRTLDTVSKECKCNDGFYDDNSSELCQTCHSACMICTTGLPNSCTVCSPLYYLLLAQTTCFETCPDFYYNFQKNFTCQACSSNCQKCLNGTYCSSCQRGYLLFNATCLSTCPGGTYANADSTVCLDCPKGCYNCSGNSQCFSCFSKYYFNPGLGFCFSCNDVCLNCTGPGQTECTACSSPMVLMKGTCSVLSCGLGTYVDPISGCVECGKKYPGATLCNITQPLSCSSQYIFSSNQCVQCKDARGYQVLSDNTCGEICGDGILIYLQCDDGNTLNGDGCSSKCTIEPGWNCSSSPSKCQLISPLQLRVLQATKKPGVNSISLLLEMSLPIRVTVSSFSISMTGLGSDRFTYSIAQQESNLSVVAIEMNYRDSLQGRKLEISYSSASSSGRRLLQGNQRVLANIIFSTSFDISPFPPADYYPDNTLATFTAYRNYLNALAIALLVLSVVLVPKRMHLHALSSAYLPALLYIGFGILPANYTDWVQFTLQDMGVQAMIGGVSLGSCCQQVNAEFGMTSEIMKESGIIVFVMVGSWVLLAFLLLFDAYCLKIQSSLKLVRYFIFTLNLCLSFPLIFTSATAWHKYALLTPNDAFNTVLSILLSLFFGMAVVGIWVRSYQIKAEVKKDERKIYSLDNSKANEAIFDLEGGGSIEKEKESQGHIENNSRAELGSSEQAETKMRRTSQQLEVQSKLQQMGRTQQIVNNELEPFLFDYFNLYNHESESSASKSKYYLPVLFTKIYLSALLAALLINAPLAYFVAIGLIELVFLVFLLAVRPFISTFTNFRLVAVSIALLAGEIVMAMYLYYSGKNEYKYFYEQLTVYILLGVLSLAVLFAFLQHILAWKHELWRRLLEPCLKGTRLMGTRRAPVFTFEETSSGLDKTMKISGASFRPREEVEEMDAFYARMLKKETLNKKYRRERMLR